MSRSIIAVGGLLAALAIPSSVLAARSSRGDRPPTAPAQTATTANASAQTSTPTCGDESLPPDPNGGTWTCRFDDEFDSATGDANSLNTSWWRPQVTATSGYTTGPAGSPVCYVNSPANVSVSNGALHLTVVRQSSAIDCGGLFTTHYTGGMVSTYSTFDQTYGRFEVRALLPQTTAQGLQETLWLYPETDTYGPWPASGEVDFSEFYSDYSTLDVPYIHYDYDPLTTLLGENAVTAYCPIDPSQYNDYAVTWEPGSFTITINGNTCLIDNYDPDGGLSSPEPFDQPFFIALTQALGIDGNAFESGTTPLPATTSIKYVRAWN